MAWVRSSTIRYKILRWNQMRDALAGGEIEIVEAIRRRAGLSPGRGLVLGIGDDCAIYRPRGGREDLLFTTDLLVEDVHFQHGTHPAEAVGHKALARGLSDVAAMGGSPVAGRPIQAFCRVPVVVCAVTTTLLAIHRCSAIVA